MLRLLVLLYYYHKNKKDRQKRNKLFHKMGVSSNCRKISLATSGYLWTIKLASVTPTFIYQIFLPTKNVD